LPHASTALGRLRSSSDGCCSDSFSSSSSMLNSSSNGVHGRGSSAFRRLFFVTGCSLSAPWRDTFDGDISQPSVRHRPIGTVLLSVMIHHTRQADFAKLLSLHIYYCSIQVLVIRSGLAAACSAGKISELLHWRWVTVCCCLLVQKHQQSCSACSNRCDA